MKFETMQKIHFLSDVFGLWTFRNFAIMATWRNDFPSLLVFLPVICSVLIWPVPLYKIHNPLTGADPGFFLGGVHLSLALLQHQ